MTLGCCATPDHASGDCVISLDCVITLDGNTGVVMNTALPMTLAEAPTERDDTAAPMGWLRSTMRVMGCGEIRPPLISSTVATAIVITAAVRFLIRAQTRPPLTMVVWLITRNTNPTRINTFPTKVPQQLCTRGGQYDRHQPMVSCPNGWSTPAGQSVDTHFGRCRSTSTSMACYGNVETWRAAHPDHLQDDACTVPVSRHASQ